LSDIKERYRPLPIAVNTAVPFTSQQIGGFLCQTAGTVSLTTVSGTVILNAFPVLAGVYYPMPFYVHTQGGTFTTAGGASGVLGT